MPALCIFKINVIKYPKIPNIFLVKITKICLLISIDTEHIFWYNILIKANKLSYGGDRYENKKT